MLDQVALCPASDSVSNGRWPRLGEFPLTNAIGAATLIAWLGTGAVAIVFAIVASLCSLPSLVVPAAWWDALKWFAAYAFLQFGAKRASHAELWKREGNGNGAPKTP